MTPLERDLMDYLFGPPDDAGDYCYTGTDWASYYVGATAAEIGAALRSLEDAGHIRASGDGCWQNLRLNRS
jgi:hypothetical protein